MGHYYAFIYDRKECMWYRFNDFKVTPESEDRVFEESFGGNGQKTCAYGLIYINQEIESTISKTNFTEYNMLHEQYIPASFVKKIKGDNYQFNDLVTQYQVDKIVKTICDKYK